MAGERHYRENVDNIKWIIIDDRLPDLEKLAKEVKGLGVSAEDIIGFKVESQGNFEAPATEIKDIPGLLNFAKVSKTPTFDYLGYTYHYDENGKWGEFESKKQLYKNVLYPMAKKAKDAKEPKEPINFIFLIDLDFGNNSFCGFDILTLLRKTLNPLNYQVRFITNVPRKSIKKFIDEVYGNNFIILGDDNHLSFISKDSTFRQLPIITKDYYEQFTSTFLKTITGPNQESIYGVYKPIREDKVVYLSEADIKIKIGGRLYEKGEIIRKEKLDELEDAIKEHKPTIVIINLDSYSRQIRQCIREIERISMMIPKYEIQGFSVYFVASSTETGSLKSLGNSRWKTFFHTVNKNSENKNLELEVKVTDVSSPLYWKFRTSINLYRQYVHDLKHALDSRDEINKIKEEIEASLKFSYDEELDDLSNKLDELGENVAENLSIDNIEKSLEKILWVVVGVDGVSVKNIVTKLKNEYNVLIDKYLNYEDEFIGLKVDSDNGSILDQINKLDEYENIIFLFDDVMPCYDITRKDFTKAFEKIKSEFDKGEEGKFKDTLEIIDKGFSKSSEYKENYYTNTLKILKEEFTIPEIEKEEYKKARDRKEFIKEKLIENYFGKAYESIENYFKNNKIGGTNTGGIPKGLGYFNKIKEEFEKEYLAVAFEFIEEEYNKKVFTKALEIIKEEFEKKEFDKALKIIIEEFEVDEGKEEEFNDTLGIIEKEFKRKKFTSPVEVIEEEFEKANFSKALEILEEKFKKTNFTYRILERTEKWTLKTFESSEWKQIYSEYKKKYNDVKKDFKSRHKCLDSFVYSCPDSQPIFTVDRLFFMREDLKKSHSYARNPAFNELMRKLKKSNSIPNFYSRLADVLKNKSAEWQIIEWKSNNGCDEKYNEEILINRLCILDFFYGNKRTGYWSRLNLLEQFIKEKIAESNLSWWNFLHQQYAFNTHQETKFWDKGRNVITILSDSLFEYEKNYLDEKYNNK